jgi:hypothetical protein
MYGGDEYYIRYTDDGGVTWTDWEQIYHTGMTPNFTAMPQVGGDPIVESGSNSNGAYTKFADGTLMCWHTLSNTNIDTGSSAGLNYSAPQFWNFPVTFLTSPSITERFQKQSAGGVTWAGSSNRDVTNSLCNGLAAVATETGQSGYFMVQAIGRWF